MFILPVVVGMLAGLSFLVLQVMLPEKESEVTTFGDKGCTFTVSSSYELFASDQAPWPWRARGPWRVSHLVANIGNEKCVVQGEYLTALPVKISPGEDLRRTAYSVTRPKPMTRELSFGKENPTSKAQVKLYGEPH